MLSHCKEPLALEFNVAPTRQTLPIHHYHNIQKLMPKFLSFPVNGLLIFYISDKISYFTFGDFIFGNCIADICPYFIVHLIDMEMLHCSIQMNKYNLKLEVY